MSSCSGCRKSRPSAPPGVFRKLSGTVQHVPSVAHLEHTCVPAPACIKTRTGADKRCGGVIATAGQFQLLTLENQRVMPETSVSIWGQRRQFRGAEVCTASQRPGVAANVTIHQPRTSSDHHPPSPPPRRCVLRESELILTLASQCGHRNSALC